MAKLNQAPLFAFFFLLISLSKAADELLCCNGWSDVETKMLISAHDRAGKSTPLCKAEQHCEGKKCVVEYGSEFSGVKTGEKTGEPIDCHAWTPSEAMCTCETNWCNCPNEFKTKPIVPKPKGLKCCDNTEGSVNKVTCSEDIPQPLGCIAGGDKKLKCGLGNRFPSDCKTFGDGTIRGTCYCLEDECNCPRDNPAPPPPGPAGPSGSGNGTNETCVNPTCFQPQNLATTPLIFLCFFIANKWILH